jgi:hypothetical protein
MKIENLLNEHKKGVKAIKYAKKPQPLVGPDAQKKKDKAKATPPKTELEKHSKLSAKLEDMTESRPKGYDSDGNPQGGGWDEYDNSKKSWTVVVDGKAWKTFDNERQAYKAADAIQQKYGKKTRVISENIAEGSTQEKLHKRHQELRKKRGAPDPEYYKELKTTFDLPDDERHAKTAELKKKYKVKDMKEAKQPEASKPRNFVAKNAKTAGAGVHKDAKKASKEVRGQKHKNKEMAEDNRTDYYVRIMTGPVYNSKGKYLGKWNGSTLTLDPDLHNKWVDENGEEWVNGTIDSAYDRLKAGQWTVKPESTPVAETYDQARAARIRYALMIKESDWDQQSDEMTPPEYDMNPEELKAIRNAEFTDEDKIQAMIKLAAGGTSDEDIAKIYDMDKETVAGILDDYVEEIEAETDQDADVKEAEMGKIVDYKPGQTATLNTGPGMTTIVDLKKNPTSLTKDPATGKLKLMGPQATGTQTTTATAQPTIKAGDAVEIGKVESIQDIRRLSGLK